MQGAVVHNWFGNITSSPRVVVEVESVDEIVAIMKDPQRYPGPVRAVGSNHSTTECGVADGGTLIVTRKMDRILEIRDDTVTAQAGALYIDVNYELLKRNLQFYVNVELGNLTIGSACCGGTKDASMPGEFGQVASYAVGIKMVTPAGELVEITESDPELLQVARSSYGLFGIVYEATFKVRPLAALAVHHETFSLDEFAQQLPALKARGESMMMYINPFLDRITVEFRRYHGAPTARDLTDWQWKIRDRVWSYLAPLYTYYVTRYVTLAGLRDWLYDAYHRLIVLALLYVVRGNNTRPQAQQIRYPAESDTARYTFSIWAFPETSYIEALRRYFEFSREYQRRKGYRVNLLSVGYRIKADQSSLFSYSFHGDVMTFDPCSTANPGWDEFLEAYNQLCTELGGVPLFNQTAHLTRPQVEKAFGDRLLLFDRYRKQYDPHDRLLNPYFRNLVAQPQPSTDQQAMAALSSDVATR
ncbi:MAG TPA: FAD-binding oxidoreductase [Herpetosiphonaceae bacterium]|nr:FAD-binding oxidoreductase [Herpetosiphonaceae bacterium]